MHCCVQNTRDGAYQPGLREWLKGQAKKGQARRAGMSVTHTSRRCLKPQGERMPCKELGKLQGIGKEQETKDRDKTTP